MSDRSAVTRAINLLHGRTTAWAEARVREAMIAAVSEDQARQREIAAALGISQARVNQILRKKT